MAKIKGYGGVVRIGAAVVGELQDWALDETARTIEGYSMGDEWETREGTVKAWSGSATAYYDPADTGQGALDLGAKVTLDFYPDGDAAGKTYRSGSAIVAGANTTAQKDGFVSVSFSFTGTGPLNVSTVAGG